MNYLDVISQSTIQSLPLLLLVVVGLSLMLLDAFKIREALPWVAGIGLAGSAIWAMSREAVSSSVAYFGMIETGGIAPMVHVFICLSGIFTLFFLKDYLDRQEKPIHSVYALIVFAVIGMIMMANSRDLLITFVGLETMSMCLYIFAALYKMDPKSNESGLKYFLLGSFASAFLLFGIALVYGVTGYGDTSTSELFVSKTNYTYLAERLSDIAIPKEVMGIDAAQRNIMLLVGAGFILIGFLFKVAAFPFHNWTPDVYEGTPTPLAGFMATGSKMASFIALGVFINELNLLQFEKLYYLLIALSLFSMIYGNIVAARQKNLKRMLAYSSIAHTGYVLLGLCAWTGGLNAIIFYMFIYTLMNVGAFGIISMAERDYPDTDRESWRGFGAKSPMMAGALALFMLSLAGIPPLAGFMAKYFVFISVIKAGLVTFAVIGILASVVGAYYYIQVIVTMFFGKEKETSLNLNFGKVPVIGVAILVALILLYGIFPGLLYSPIEAAMSSPEASASLIESAKDAVSFIK